MKFYIPTEATISNMSDYAKAAHRAGESLGDITEAIYVCMFRSVGMEPEKRDWSIKKTNEAIERSGIASG